MSPARTVRRRPTRAMAVAAALGVALSIAPAALQMFTRAPRGGEMISAFRPFMTTDTIEGFRDDLALIGSARTESARLMASDEQRTRYPSTATFDEQWPGIDADMSNMLATMQADIGNYRGVAALPPFALFPYFFLIPGLAIVGAALLLSADRRWQRIVVAALGIGLVAAPLTFQMFSRAPGGQMMISGFSRFMTPQKVVQIQGYFLTIGAAEGELRLRVAPDVAAQDAAAQDAAARDVSAIRALSAEWPRIASTMAPMIGAMSDNVSAFQGIAALPPFGLFPWFFLIPGVALIALAAAPTRVNGELA